MANVQIQYRILKVVQKIVECYLASKRVLMCRVLKVPVSNFIKTISKTPTLELFMKFMRFNNF